MLHKRLGEGSFSKVELAKHLTVGKEVAIKIIKLDKINDKYVKENLNREADVMSRLSHPNVISLHEVCTFKNLYCLVLDYCPGGSLVELMCLSQNETGLKEDHCQRLFKQILDGVEYLHQRDVVHRDLKLDNILTNKEADHIFIGDFGLSNFCPPGHLLQTHCGSPHYAPPELFLRDHEYSKEVDVWSCGVVLYAMLTCRLPFSQPEGDSDMKVLKSRIKTGVTAKHQQRLKERKVSRECREVVHQILTVGVEVKMRPSLQQLQRSLWCSSVSGSAPSSDLTHDQQLEVAKVAMNKFGLTDWSPDKVLAYVKSSRGKLGKTAGCFNLLAKELQLKLSRSSSTPLTARTNLDPVRNVLQPSTRADVQLKFSNSPSRPDLGAAAVDHSTYCRQPRDHTMDHEGQFFEEEDEEELLSISQVGAQHVNIASTKRKRSQSGQNRGHHVLSRKDSRVKKSIFDSKPSKYLVRNIKKDY